MVIVSDSDNIEGVEPTEVQPEVDNRKTLDEENFVAVMKNETDP